MGNVDVCLSVVLMLQFFTLFLSFPTMIYDESDDDIAVQIKLIKSSFNTCRFE